MQTVKFHTNKRVFIATEIHVFGGTDRRKQISQINGGWINVLSVYWLNTV